MRYFMHCIRQPDKIIHGGNEVRDRSNVSVGHQIIDKERIYGEFYRKHYER